MNSLRSISLLFVLAWLAACGSPDQQAEEHVTAAETLLGQGDPVKAKLEAQNALQIRPKNSRARMILAQIAEQDGDVRGAIGQLVFAVDGEPDNMAARTELGTLFARVGAAAEAREQRDVVLEATPDNSEVQLLDALVKILDRDLSGALTALERSYELDSGNAEALILKAGLLAEQGNVDAALETLASGIDAVSDDDRLQLRDFRVQLLQAPGYEDRIEDELKQLIDDFPDATLYQIRLARFYSASGRNDEAEQLLRQLAENAPDDMDAKNELVVFLVLKRGEAVAETEIKALISADPDDPGLRQMLAVLYEQSDRSDDAYLEYKKLAEISPLSDAGVFARNRMIAIEVARENLDLARALTEELLADVPNNPDALMGRAAFSFIDKNYDEAIADLRVVLRTEENSERGLRLLARSYVANGNNVLAQETYRQLLTLKPGDERASAELVALLSRQGNAAAAADVLRDRLEVDPDDSQAMANLVQTLLAQQDVGAAELEARRLADMNRNTALAQLQLGKVMQAKGATEDAITAYKLTLEEDPEAVQALQGLAKVLTDAGRLDEALQVLQDHVDRHPDQVAARLILGSYQGFLGNSDAAQQEYESVITERPDNVEAYMGLASLFEPGSGARIAAFQRGYDANPNDPRLSMMLASAMQENEQYEDAISVYQKYVDENPGNVVFANNLAALLLDQRDDAASHARALELLKQYDSSDDPIVLDTLGWAYYRNGDYARAVRKLERAVANAGQVPIMQYHLGMAYAKNNNTVGAKQALTKALEMGDGAFSGDQEARDTLAKIQESS